MRRAGMLLLAVVLIAVCSGCTMPNGAILAPVTVTRSAVAMGDPTAQMSKTGQAKAEGIILVGFGDASIATAAKNGGITKIHHVDSEELCVLGLYSRFTTIVYGE